MRPIPKTKGGEAYAAIKAKIIEGRLEPGRDVSEDWLEKELGLGRTPVREACKRLAEEGFLQIYPSKGMIVSDITADLIRDIYQMRILNEPFIVQQACRLADNVDWLLDLRRKILEPPQSPDERTLRHYYIALDRELHDQFLKGCRNRFLLASMQNVLDHNHRIRIKVSRPYDPADRSIREHLDIIEAFLSRDEEAVGRRVAEHVEESRKITFAYFL
ncbi:GntR family transcriptional regulator [Salipiger sp.]|uniref:GntR family transcriptional regulator n=1 Tax=Salipiger sp. TaxID=2078585 RepID=UPI003A982DDA